MGCLFFYSGVVQWERIQPCGHSMLYPPDQVLDSQKWKLLYASDRKLESVRFQNPRNREKRAVKVEIQARCKSPRWVHVKRWGQILRPWTIQRLGVKDEKASSAAMLSLRHNNVRMLTDGLDLQGKTVTYYVTVRANTMRGNCDIDGWWQALRQSINNSTMVLLPIVLTR